MKRLFTLAAVLIMTVTLAACSGDSAGGAASPVNGNASPAGGATPSVSETTSSVHDYTYVALSGNEYAGTYTGGWENDRPNGEGEFSGRGENAEVSLVGAWSNGQPNGQCRQIVKTDTMIKTYTGDFFYGEIRGSGTFKIEDLSGNLLYTYSGEFQEGKNHGSGEVKYYYTAEEAAESGIDSRIYKGQFSNGTWNGEGELTVYYTEERAVESGLEGAFYQGTFSNGKMNGEMELLLYTTEEGAAKYGYDYEYQSGEYKDGNLIGSKRYALVKGDKVIESGTIRDGRYVSDTEKAIKDGIYDGLQEAAGDGFWGLMFDLVAPEFYDRYAD